MKKVVLSCIIWVLFMSGCTTLQFTSKKVTDGTATYYLPKKDLLLGFNVTYKTIQKFTVSKTTTSISGVDSSLETKTLITPKGTETFVPNSVKVTDVQIAENLVSDFSQGYTVNTSDFSNRNGKKLKQSLVFNPGSQSLTSINGEAGTYTTEILQGISTGLQVIGKIVGAVLSGGTSTLTSEVKTLASAKKDMSVQRYNADRAAKKVPTRTFTLTYDSIATTTYAKGYIKNIKPEDASTTIEISEGSLFSQTLKLTANKISEASASVKVENEVKPVVYYRQPALVRYELNNVTKNPIEFLFSKTITIPQLGSLAALLTKVSGRNPTLVVEFDENGALKKYELNKDNASASNVEAIQTITDKTNELIKDYKYEKLENELKYLKIQKDITDQKKPATD